MKLRAVPAAIVAAAMAVSALPWLLGLRVEHDYRGLLAALAADGYGLIEQDYQRGWRRSSARLLVAPPSLRDDAEPPRLRIAVRIVHGPPGLADMLRWPPVLGFARARVTVVDAPRALPPLLVDALIGPFGGLDLALRLPDSSYAGEAGRLLLTDVRTELDISADRRAWRARGVITGFEAVADDARRLAVEGLSWQADVDSGDAGLPLGVATLTLEHMSLGYGDTQPSLAAGGVRIALRSRLSAAERAAMEAEIEVDRLIREQSELAPSRAELSLTGLHAPTLAALWSGVMALNQRQLPASMRGLALGGLLGEHLPALLSSGPGAKLAPLEVTTPHGMLTAALSLTVKASEVQADPTSPRTSDWLSRLSGEARLSAPQPLLLQLLVQEKERRVRAELRHRGEPVGPLAPSLKSEVEQAAQASLAGLIRDGWLQANAGRLIAAAVVGDGLLTINGKTWPITRNAAP
ncbi:MAG: YdgA family protein [Thiohalocapsa sp.]|nr:YdgA family protein [Thiohalocapsa sp.]